MKFVKFIVIWSLSPMLLASEEKIDTQNSFLSLKLIQSSVKSSKDLTIDQKKRAETYIEKLKKIEKNGDLTKNQAQELATLIDFFADPALEPFPAGSEPSNHLDLLQTLSGKTFKNVKIRQVTPMGISFFHEQGVATVDFSNLPKELQTRFHYDPEKAKEYAQQVREQEELNALHQQKQVSQQRLSDANQSLLDSIKKSAVGIWVEVFQQTGSECLCNWGYITKSPVYDHSGLSPKVTSHQLVANAQEESTIIVYGLNGLVDTSKWQGVLYPVGTKTYESLTGKRTVRTYAATPELAFKMLTK